MSNVELIRRNYLIMPAAAAEQVIENPVEGIPEHMIHADAASFYVKGVEVEGKAKRTAVIAGEMCYKGQEQLASAEFQISMPGMIERGLARLMGKSDELQARVQYSEYNVTS